MFADILRRFSQNILTATRTGATYVRSSPNDIVIYKWKRHFRIANTRCYFPRPNETMRIKKHGWNTRISTESGRRILMNRILKGRHVLSH